MQNPTATGIRIRSARDANILFHAVALNLLPLITRRLDEAERLQVKSGCVYVWEERNPSYFDFNGQEMKRFTEGASIPAHLLSVTNSVPRSSQFSYHFHQEEAGARPRREMYAARFLHPPRSCLFFVIAPGISVLLREGKRHQVPNGGTHEVWAKNVCYRVPPRLFACSSNQPRNSTRAQLVKQTYSVNVHSRDSQPIRKWHLSEYAFPCFRGFVY